MKSSILAAVIVVALAAGAAPGRAAESPAAVTITAPDATTVVTLADVAHWVPVARASGARTRKEAEHEVVPLLVDFAWIAGEARERGIAVTDAEVSAETDRQRRESFDTTAAFQRFLRESHQTLTDIQERVRLDMLSAWIRDQVIAPAAATVTGAAVDAALAAAGPERIPETRDVRLVLTRTRASAQAARAALEAGATWSAVARQYSSDRSTRRHGGLVRGVARAGLAHRMGRAVFGVKRRHVHGPIKTADGYFVFAVVRIHPERIVPVARQRKEIRERLVADAQQKTFDDFVTAFQAKWRSRTVCAPAFTWVDDCSNS